MSINSVQGFKVNNTYQPKFTAQHPVKDIDKGYYIERHIKTEASTGKKWGVGIASAFMGGLGQFINGDVGKGFAFLAGSIVAAIPFIRGVGKGNSASYWGGLVASLGIGLWSIIDAVKNAKSETVQIIQKDKV